MDVISVGLANKALSASYQSSNLLLTYDLVRDFGASGSSNTYTGSMTAGSKTLTLTAGSDFKLGQGISVPGAAQIANPTAALTLTPASGGFIPSGTVYATFALMDVSGNYTNPAPMATATLSATGQIQFTLPSATDADQYAIYCGTTNAPLLVGTIDQWGTVTYASGNTGNNGYDMVVTSVTPTLQVIVQAVGTGSGLPTANATVIPLVSTVDAFNGSTLTLADAAQVTVSAVTVSHDDGAVLNTTLNSLTNQKLIVSQPVNIAKGQQVQLGDGFSESALEFVGEGIINYSGAGPCFVLTASARGNLHTFDFLNFKFTSATGGAILANGIFRWKWTGVDINMTGSGCAWRVDNANTGTVGLRHMSGGSATNPRNIGGLWGQNQVNGITVYRDGGGDFIGWHEGFREGDYYHPTGQNQNIVYDGLVSEGNTYDWRLITSDSPVIKNCYLEGFKTASIYVDGNGSDPPTNLQVENCYSSQGSAIDFLHVVTYLVGGEVRGCELGAATTTIETNQCSNLRLDYIPTTDNGQGTLINGMGKWTVTATGDAPPTTAGFLPGNRCTTNVSGTYDHIWELDVTGTWRQIA